MAKPPSTIGKAKRAAAMQRRLDRGKRKMQAKAARAAGPRNRWR